MSTAGRRGRSVPPSNTGPPEPTGSDSGDPDTQAPGVEPPTADVPSTITSDEYAKLHELIRDLQAQINVKSPYNEEYKPVTPEFFDGRSASQLHNFLSQVRVFLGAQPVQFNNDKKKIMLTVSLLRGPALVWLRPYLNMDDPPAWMNDFSLFTAELNEAFDDPDIAGSNFRRLKRLKQTGSVATYTAEFRRLASQLTWSDQALVQQYFEGLKDTLQDALIAANYPEELEALARMATRMDNLQHQRRMQRGQEAKPAVPVQRKKQPPYAATKPQPAFHARPANPPYGTPTAPADSSGPRPMEPDATRPRFQRLTEEQKEHRRKNNLCLYCGDPSHFARACPTRPKVSYRPARVSAIVTTAGQGNIQTQLEQ